MAQAIFSSNITYTPGGGGSLTQAFNTMMAYTAISSGTYDVPGSAVVTDAFDIPFGSVESPRGVVLRNNTTVDIKVYVNQPSASLSPSPGPAGAFHLPPGGVVMYCAPVAPAASALNSVRVFLTAPGLGTPPVSVGTIDYITLGS